jgi:uncharacterized membrane protein YtjA (UPF0391 family)
LFFGSKAPGEAGRVGGTPACATRGAEAALILSAGSKKLFQKYGVYPSVKALSVGISSGKQGIRVAGVVAFVVLLNDRARCYPGFPQEKAVFAENGEKGHCCLLPFPCFPGFPHRMPIFEIVSNQRGGNPMLRMALLFLIIALIAGAFGFGTISAVSWGIGKILFFVFIVLAVLFLLGGMFGGRRSMW